MHIEHIAIWTADLERLKDFYERYFDALVGPKYTNPTRGFMSYFLSFGPGARIELMQMPGIPSAGDPAPPVTGLAHLAIAVGSTAAVDSLTTRLANAGIRIAGQPRWTGDGYYESVILDPDGNRVEITV